MQKIDSVQVGTLGAGPLVGGAGNTMMSFITAFLLLKPQTAGSRLITMLILLVKRNHKHARISPPDFEDPRRFGSTHRRAFCFACHFF